MSFDEARWLYLLILLPPLALWSRSRYGAKVKAFFDLAGRRDDGTLQASASRRQALSLLLFFLSISCGVVALAGPRWGEHLVPEYRSGLDVAFAFDVSRSMDARDAVPTRLRRGAYLARELVRRGGPRCAVALGKGDGVLAVPLTEDQESVLSLLETMGSPSLSSGGTDLERLLDAARSAFPSPSPSRKLIVLFSDGESLSGDLAAAAQRAADDGARIAAVGLGSAEGAFVPDSQGGFVKDADGKRIRSKLRADALRKAAERSGGVYIDGSSPETASALASLASSLSSPASSDSYRREAMPRYRLFALLALFCFLGSKFAVTVPRRRP